MSTEHEQRFEAQGQRYICRECKNLIGEWRGGSDYCTEVCATLGRVRAEGAQAEALRIAAWLRREAFTFDVGEWTAESVARDIESGTHNTTDTGSHTTEGPA